MITAMANKLRIISDVKVAVRNETISPVSGKPFEAQSAEKDAHH